MILHTQKPREQSGRDTFSRYKAQIRSAALATLSILEGTEVDRVYCDLHDDFVLRLNKDGQYFYIFYQVKTNNKQNHNWSLNEVFGINPRTRKSEKHDVEKIKNSFAGKLLLHTVTFGDKCEAVIFQTNINIDNIINELVADLREDVFTSDAAKILLERFTDCFECHDLKTDQIKNNIKKITFETDVNYLKQKNDHFEPIAREKIYEYSEIDLSRDEARDILLKLIDLVQTKSSGIIHEITESSIEDLAGISISDLLDILSISKEAYKCLAEGGDSKAVKSASIIQRTLIPGGATEEQIEFCSRCKIQWDNWFRKNRHILPEYDVLKIQSDCEDILRKCINNNSIKFSDIELPINQYFHNTVETYDLNKEIILGGVFAALVRTR